MEELKLSQLSDETELACDIRFGITTAKELKKDIEVFGEELKGEWYVAIRKKWKSCARSMIEHYIENEDDQMYEDWDERARECISDELVQQMQVLLDNAFSGDDVSVYWEWGNPIEVDVFPKR